MTEKNWTVLELLNWTTPYFQQAQMESSRLAAELLLASVLECQRIELYTRFDHTPTPDQLTAYRELVRRASQHEPVAYLIGVKEFYSLPFIVTPAVLIPRPETELVVDHAVEHLRQLDTPPAVWDVCTGSGCVALATAQQVPTARALATDISADAITIAQANTDALDLSARVTCIQADLLTRPTVFTECERFDVITANPPYVAQDDWVAPSVAYEPEMALYAEDSGLAIIAQLIETAPANLTPGGCLIMEFGMGQAQAIWDMTIRSEEFGTPTILKDHQDIERILIAERK
jgi:release factor glutamine methyltransferase